MGVSAQVSLYPLAQGDIAPAIEEFLRVLGARGLSYNVGAMSTVLSGDDQTVFAALREAFAAATSLGPAVMTVTVSNVCPLPGCGGAGAER